MNKNIFRLIILIALTVLSLISCKKDKQNDTADADVYVKSILVDGEPVFGLAHYVIGYAPMSAVTVQSPGGSSDQLTAYDSENTVFYSEPSTALGTYSGTPPEPGTYRYEVVFKDGTEKVITDQLSDIYLLPPAITSISKSTGSQSVNLNWDPITGAEYLQLSIYKDGAIQYTSNLFTPPSGNTLVVSISLIPAYTPGVYTFQLDAIAFDSDNSNKVQAISTTSVSTNI